MNLFGEDDEMAAVVTAYAEKGASLHLGEADFDESWRRLASLGVLGRPGSIRHAVAAIEGLGLAGVDPGICYAVASQLFGLQLPLRRLLSEEQLSLLEPVEAGRTRLCHASTEEGGGSDPLAMATSATRRDDGSYVLNGRKAFVTAAPVADVALVFARTEAGRSPFALSAFLVDLDAPGVRREAPVEKTAIVGAPMGGLTFDGVLVPPGRLVAEAGSGLAVLGVTTSWERALLLSYALGPMRLLLERTVEWCRTRRQFDRPMGANARVAARVADIALRVHRSRALVYAMAARLDDGVPIRRLGPAAAAVKISISEDYVRLTEEAAMLAGVRAYVEGMPLRADPASALAALTYAGPNDLLRVTIARDLGLPVEN
jgi:alkylation response protein AidB-like acyl-CoA dehydrogenase